MADLAILVVAKLPATACRAQYCIAVVYCHAGTAVRVALIGDASLEVYHILGEVEAEVVSTFVDGSLLLFITR